MNYAIAKESLDSPMMAGFVKNLSDINKLAEDSQGFIWRLIDETETVNISNLVPANNPADLPIILNISVWRSVKELYDFVYRTAHLGVLKQGDSWFMPAQGPSMVLWHLSDGAAMPDEAEAFARLASLASKGPTAYAFDWKTAKAFAPA